MTVLAAFERPSGRRSGRESRWPLDGPSMVARGTTHRPPGAGRGLRRPPGFARSRSSRSTASTAAAGAPIIVDGSVWGVIATSSPDAPLPDHARGSARGVHRARGNRDRQQPGPRGAHAARGGAGGVAAGGDAGRSGRATGRGVRSRERGGGRTARRGRFRAHALRGRRDRHRGKRLDDRGRLQLRREALRARRHRVRPDLRDRPARTRRRLRRRARRGGRRPPARWAGARPWERRSPSRAVSGASLAVVSKSEQPLPGDTEQRLAEFAELFATAIANSEAHEQLAQLADEQAALRRVATLVAEGATPHRVFDAVRGEVARMFNAPLSGLLRYDGNGTVTLLAASDGLPRPHREELAGRG